MARERARDPGDSAATSADLARMRAQYASAGLAEAELAADPLAQLRAWLADAVRAGVPEPNAMALATVSGGGQPSVRHVLLKRVDTGLVFFTNHDSRKGRELSHRPSVAACFPWFAMGRQVSVTGVAHRLDPDASAAYWALRPRDAQLGAWASRQSVPVASRETLDARLAAVERRFAGVPVPAPQFWGGYRIELHTLELWQGRTHRLHDRLRYRRSGSGWVIERLQP